MGAGHAMRRGARFVTALLLAGLAPISLPGAVWAQATLWQFSSRVDPLTHEGWAGVTARVSGGGSLRIVCSNNSSTKKYFVFARQKEFEPPPTGQVEIAWQVDKGAVRNDVWETDPSTNFGDVQIIGQRAYEFALAVLLVQERLLFRTPGGTAIYHAKGLNKAMKQMFQFCVLNQ